jgi:hypothetical protein
LTRGDLDALKDGIDGGKVGQGQHVSAREFAGDGVQLRDIIISNPDRKNVGSSILKGTKKIKRAFMLSSYFKIQFSFFFSHFR